jgi:tetratricopeptide (TPR) repeat protein
MRRTDAHVPHALLKAAISLHEAGELDEAERVYRSIPRTNPGYCSALTLLGTLHIQRGDAAEGLKLIQRSLVINRQQPTAYNSLGNAFKDLKRYPEALDNYDRALALNAEFAEAWYNRGVVFSKLERFPEAIESYGRAIAIQPTYARAFNNRGSVFRTLGQYEEALRDYDRAIALMLNDPAIYTNRAIVLFALRRYDDALASCDKAIAVDPDYPNVYCAQSAVYRALKQYPEALLGYQRAIALKPDYADAWVKQGFLKLLLGEWSQDAWDALEWWRLKDDTGSNARIMARSLGKPLWDGAGNITGKTILIIQEQGFGDIIFAARYIPMLVALGAKVVCEAPSTLTELITSVSHLTTVVLPDDPLPDFDLWCPMMSLPRAFRTTLETVPARVPYLGPVPSKVNEWHERLGPKTKPRIGIMWSGSGWLNGKVDKDRNIPLPDFQRVIQSSCEYFVLQKELLPEDIALLDTLPDTKRFSDMLETFSDTAALISEMDLIISIDTAVAHLAGALGKRVWVLLSEPLIPFWPVVGRKDCPWYPTARLFKQTRSGEWGSVLDQVAEELERTFKAV